MSLPFADSPDKSSIYNDLKVKKLVDLTADDFDAFRLRMDAQGVEGLEDEYRRLLLLGLASDKLSISGALPETTVALFFEVSDSDGYASFTFTPNKGEVYALTGIQMESTGGSVRARVQCFVNDTNGIQRVVELGDETVSATTSPFDPIGTFSGDMYIDNNCELKVYVSSLTTGETGKITIMATRVR